MVHRRTRVERIQFRKLPNGAIYYLSVGGTGPFVKNGRTTRLTTNTSPDSAGYTDTALADVSVITKKVTKFALDSQRSV